HLVDEHTGNVLCRLYPQDKTQNASGIRRSLEPLSTDPVEKPSSPGMAPLLAQLIAAQTASGLPPAYLPLDETDETGENL
ncbi:MAG: IS481 family transposase, partial [Candidatus Binataceae bacterium]